VSYDYQTSKPAYEEAKKNLPDTQFMVLKAISELLVCNDREIAERLNWPINRVTPRRGELETSGHIIQAGIYPDSRTGRRVNFWKVKASDN
jgi:hypothetical protein